MHIFGPADDQLVPLSRQRRRLADSLAELNDAEWDMPSRCSGWTVHDVVAHLVGVNDFWRVSAEAGTAGTPTRFLESFFDPAATPNQLIEPLRSLEHREILESYVTSTDRLLNVLDALPINSWTATAESPVGHVPVRLMAQHALWDAWIHERDILLPLNRTQSVEADELQWCLIYAAAVSPALALGFPNTVQGSFAVDATSPALTFTVVVDSCVTVSEGIVHPSDPILRGDALELIEALSLRTPMPSSTPEEWQQLLTGLGTAFSASA